jgi:hypothetical protein
MKKILGFLGNEILLGTMIALLSVFTAVASYQGSMADSKQNEFEIKGMKNLNDGNAEYLSANQFVVYDFTMYDGWYTAETEDKASYYEASYSEELQNAIAANPDDPFGDAYYDAMYTNANALFDKADTSFEVASQWDERGDQLQLVMLVMALGLAFAAWASLLGAESNIKLVFSLLALIMLIAGVITYIVMVPTVVA